MSEVLPYRGTSLITKSQLWRQRQNDRQRQNEPLQGDLVHEKAPPPLGPYGIPMPSPGVGASERSGVSGRTTTYRGGSLIRTSPPLRTLQ